MIFYPIAHYAREIVMRIAGAVSMAIAAWTALFVLPVPLCICGRNRVYREKRDQERFFLPDVDCDAVIARTERLQLETVEKKYRFPDFPGFFWNWNKKEQQISIL